MDRNPRADAGRDGRPPRPWEELHRYWLSRHVGGRPPSRAEIDPPIDLPKLAGNLTIMDITPDGYHYRLFGSAIANRNGREMTGKILSYDRPYPDAIVQFRDALGAVVKTGRPSMLIARLPGATQPDHVLLALPLVQPGGALTQIIAGFFYDSRVDPNAPIQGIEPAEVRFAADVSPDGPR
jgi:hypothetical protein